MVIAPFPFESTVISCSAASADRNTGQIGRDGTDAPFMQHNKQEPCA
jgi:hypothetical protein